MKITRGDHNTRFTFNAPQLMQLKDNTTLLAKMTHEDGTEIMDIHTPLLVEMIVQFIETLDFKKDFDRATYDHIRECMHAHFRSQ